jgi:phenylacetate-CoA ligase
MEKNLFYRSLEEKFLNLFDFILLLQAARLYYLIRRSMVRGIRFLVFNFSLPAFDLAKGFSVRRDYLMLKQISTFSRERILDLQRQKLRSLIVHAWENVPYYRDIMAKSGLTPVDIMEVEDLTKLPVLRRTDMQKFADEMISKETDLSKCNKGSSSGSTGEPVTYLRDKAGCSASYAAQYFGWGLSGWEFGDPFLTIWGNITTVKKDWTKMSSKIKSRLFREIKVPAFRFSDPEKLFQLYEICKMKKFKYIWGYTNAIHAFAEHLIDRGLSLPRVQGVLTTAENLQHHQRKAINKAIGPVFDFYGCGEVNAIAFQCREGSYHIIDPHVIVEYGAEVDDQGNQELYITDLDNLAMPLIRYANGDMGRPINDGPCVCGLLFGKLGGISGRTSEVIRTPEGGILSVPSFFGSRLLKELSHLVRYRVDIVAKDELVINLQLRGMLTEIEDELIRNSLKEYIPKSMKWSIHLVDDIKPEINGKYKLIVDRTKLAT